MARKKKDELEGKPDERENVHDEDEDEAFAQPLDDDDDDSDGEEENEDIEEMEEIEAKLENGEDFTTTSSDASMLLRSRVIYACPLSRKIYYKNKWIKDTVTDIYTVRTELAICDQYLKRAKDYGYFIGSIEIFDKQLKDRKKGFVSLAKNVEAGLENRMPFDVIINIKEENDILFIFTNTTRLAIEIARGIRHEWNGAIQYEWFERNQFVRAKWFSEVQNREYFKSRIRAAKEKRIGLFNFEET